MKCYTPAYQSQMLYPETVIVFSTFHIGQIRTPHQPPPPVLYFSPICISCEVYSWLKVIGFVRTFFLNFCLQHRIKFRTAQSYREKKMEKGTISLARHYQLARKQPVVCFKSLKCSLFNELTMRNLKLFIYIAYLVSLSNICSAQLFHHWVVERCFNR